MAAMDVQKPRALVVVALCAVAVSVIALLVVIILRGGVQLEAGPVTGLISFVGIIVGLLVAILQGQQTQHLVVDIGKRQDVQEEKLNGHLADHDPAPAPAPAKEG